MSNQIELIQKLYAKDKMYKFPKEAKDGEEQIELAITPLSLEDMGVLDVKENMDMKEMSNNAKTMFSKSLGITEDEASKISLEYMEEMFNAIMDANNFNEEDMKKTGIKDFIKKKKEQTEEKKSE